MAYPWFKFYGVEYLSDPKIISLNSAERSCWITILALASQNNGQIKYVSVESILRLSGIEQDVYGEDKTFENTKNILETLSSYQMITVDNGVITVLNWRKRQDLSQTPYERLKKHRAKKRNDNAMITVDKIRIDKNRIDKNISDSNLQPTVAEKEPPEVNKIFDIFYKINPTLNYGNKTQRSAAARLIKRFGVEKATGYSASATAIYGKQFAPTITNPVQLESKLSELAAFYKRNEVTQIQDISNL